MIELFNVDCLGHMKTMEPNSVDAIVTDPPYGLSFMGKKWDYDVPEQAIWEECLRVLKPGGHLLAFAGTRTQHRMAVRIEDAGFEIRDMIAWVYGSGFPKSHSIGKAIDREAGERGAVGKRFVAAGGDLPSPERNYDDPPLVLEAAKQWQGWGTALKPSYEPLTFARKPLDIRTHCVYLAQYLTSQICQYSAGVRGAAPSSSSSQNVSSAEPSDFVLWTAVGGCNTPGDLFALMDTLAYGPELPLTLSTVCSWLRTLDGLLQHESTFTTETVSSLTTDLKTLNSLLSTNTPAFTIEELTEPSGRGSSAELVACIFNAFDASLKSILARFVHGNAIAKAQENYLDAGVSPSLEPITVARKPLAGTVASNVLQHGTGAINVDGCRVDAGDGRPHIESMAEKSQHAFGDGLNGSRANGTTTTGRWPANLIHDGSEEVVVLFPDVKAGVAVRSNSGGNTFGGDNPKPPMDDMSYGDKGSAARFFYCAKASKADRDEGLNGFAEVRKAGADFRPNHSEKAEQGADGNPYGRWNAVRNNHPTVKPTDLMRYLCRLVTPPGGTVFDPFMGSGSTGKAAVLEGFSFIGCDLQAEYVAIAKARCAWAEEEHFREHAQQSLFPVDDAPRLFAPDAAPIAEQLTIEQTP